MFVVSLHKSRQWGTLTLECSISLALANLSGFIPEVDTSELKERTLEEDLSQFFHRLSYISA